MKQASVAQQKFLVFKTFLLVWFVLYFPLLAHKLSKPRINHLSTDFIATYLLLYPWYSMYTAASIVYLVTMYTRKHFQH